MAEFPLPPDTAERYAAIEQAYVEDHWTTVLSKGENLLKILEQSDDPEAQGLANRVRLLLGHAHLYGLSEPEVAEDYYHDVLAHQAETELRRIATEGLQQCQRPTAPRASAALEAQAQAWVGKLEGQDSGQVARGRKLSDSGAKARLYHEVKEAHLAKILKVDLKGELFNYTIDERALAQAELMDGKLLLVTNVKDLSPKEVVQRYKSLADIERGFRVLKSEIEIAPVYHRLPERIRAHAFVCFLALIVYRVMRQRLKLAKSELSPEKALAQLRRIQRHQVRINQAAPITGISTINDDQARVLETLKIKKPTQNAQLSLL
jgi:IS4 transposase